MIAAVDKQAATAGSVDRAKPSERLEFVLKPYIVERLRKDSAEYGRGFPAHAGRIVGVTRTHMHDVIKKGKGISEDFVHGVARLWHISPEQLGKLADEAAARTTMGEADTSPAARLIRMVDEEIAERLARGERPTVEQMRSALSLAASSGTITRSDVRRAFDRKDDTESIDSELEHEHTGKRGGKRR
jgi:hypothetical protein